MTAKLAHLKELLREMDGAVVAFSSGVDSTFLLHVAHEVLEERVIAATIRSHTFPKRELDEAVAFCHAEGVRHEIIDSEELDIPGFAENPPDRCYHCKRELFSRLLVFAHANGLAAVLEGSNIDDDGDYRPGRCAIKELGIRSPLHEAGLSKAEIRALSRKMGLPTSDKPPFACLASRFPYGERITAGALERVERAEQWLLDAGLGLKQLRVRSHGDLARIEVPPGDIPRLAARAAEISAAVILKFVNCHGMKVSVSSRGGQTHVLVDGGGSPDGGDKERLRKISGVSCPYVIDEKANTIKYKSNGHDERPSKTYRIPLGAASKAVNALVKGMVDGIRSGSKDWFAPFTGDDAKALGRETRLDNQAFLKECVTRALLKGKANQTYANSAQLYYYGMFES